RRTPTRHRRAPAAPTDTPPATRTPRLAAPGPRRRAAAPAPAPRRRSARCGPRRPFTAKIIDLTAPVEPPRTTPVTSPSLAREAVGEHPGDAEEDRVLVAREAGRVVGDRRPA